MVESQSQTRSQSENQGQSQSHGQSQKECKKTNYEASAYDDGYAQGCEDCFDNAYEIGYNTALDTIKSGENGKYIDDFFIQSFSHVARRAHNVTVSKGFWDTVELRNKGEMISLMHAELSESLEGLRNPHPDPHLPHRDNHIVELADCIIRIMDFAFGFDLDCLPEVILEKIKYNAKRPEKHGKKF